MKIAYLLDSFPNVSTTFIINEIFSVMGAGVPCHVFSLSPGNTEVVHPRARALLDAGCVTYCEGPTAKGTLVSLAGRALRHPSSTLRTVNQVRTAGRDRWIAREALGIAATLQAQGFTNVHAHFADRAAQTAMWVGRWTGIPFTFTTHRYDIYERPPGNMAELVAAAYRMICISHYNRDYLISHFGLDEEKLAVVRCGIYIDEFEGETRVPAPGMAVVRLLCVARLEPEKGHTYLLQATRLLCDAGLNVELVLVGDGKLRDELSAQAAQLGLGSRVTFLGARSATEVREQFEACDIAVLASLSEGVPIATMEGMISGRPVIAPAVLGVPELVEDRVTGFLCEPGSPESMARAVQWILANPERTRKIVEAGKQKVTNDFCRETCTEELIALWRQQPSRKRSHFRSPPRQAITLPRQLQPEGRRQVDLQGR
jgi:glycosyltransferase involved in cell wall biosynthesis